MFQQFLNSNDLCNVIAFTQRHWFKWENAKIKFNLQGKVESYRNMVTSAEMIFDPQDTKNVTGIYKCLDIIYS